MGKYIALVRTYAVRDVQICTSEDADLLDGEWVDLEMAEVFIGVFEGTEKEARAAAAASWAIAESNIRLVEV